MKWTSSTMGLPDIKLRSKRIRKILASTYYEGPPDLQVRCLDGVVKCHRKILAAFSTYFASMEPEIRAILIPNVPLEVFTTIVSFHQTGSCALRRKNMDTVLCTVKTLGFKDLRVALEKIVKSEAPGVYAVEEFVQGTTSSESEEEDDDDDLDDLDDEEEESICEVILEDRKQMSLEGYHEAEALNFNWGSMPSDCDDDQTYNGHLDLDMDLDMDDVLDDGAFEGFDEEWTPNMGRHSMRSPKSDSVRSSLDGKRSMPRWTKEEVAALKEIWPQFKCGHRRDMKAIAEAMQARGFKCGIEQIRAKLYRLRMEERCSDRKQLSGPSDCYRPS